MEDCIFCKIIKGEVKAHIIFEDDVCLAFTPLKPVVNGHMLLVPKIHFENLFDIDDEVFKNLVFTGKKIASDMIKENSATGINFLHASGKDAQQSVFHFHLHIVPRRPNDRLDLWVKSKL